MRVAFDIVQHEYLAHPLRQLLHGFFEPQTEQCFFRPRANRHRVRDRRFMLDAAFPPPASMEGAIYGNAVQPGGESRFATESAERAENPYPRFLRPVFRETVIGGEPFDDREDTWRIHPVDLADRYRIAFLRSLNQFCLRQSKPWSRWLPVVVLNVMPLP